MLEKWTGPETLVPHGLILSSFLLCFFSISNVFPFGNPAGTLTGQQELSLLCRFVLGGLRGRYSCVPLCAPRPSAAAESTFLHWAAGVLQMGSFPRLPHSTLYHSCGHQELNCSLFISYLFFPLPNQNLNRTSLHLLIPAMFARYRLSFSFLLFYKVVTRKQGTILSLVWTTWCTQALEGLTVNILSRERLNDLKGYLVRRWQSRDGGLWCWGWQPFLESLVASFTKEGAVPARAFWRRVF